MDQELEKHLECSTLYKDPGILSHLGMILPTMTKIKFPAHQQGLGVSFVFI